MVITLNRQSEFKLWWGCTDQARRDNSPKGIDHEWDTALECEPNFIGNAPAILQELDRLIYNYRVPGLVFEILVSGWRVIGSPTRLPIEQGGVCVGRANLEHLLEEQAKPLSPKGRQIRSPFLDARMESTWQFIHAESMAFIYKITANATLDRQKFYTLTLEKLNKTTITKETFLKCVIGAATILKGNDGEILYHRDDPRPWKEVVEDVLWQANTRSIHVLKAFMTASMF